MYQSCFTLHPLINLLLLLLFLEYLQGLQRIHPSQTWDQFVKLRLFQLRSLYGLKIVHLLYISITSFLHVGQVNLTLNHSFSHSQWNICNFPQSRWTIISFSSNSNCHIVQMTEPASLTDSAGFTSCCLFSSTGMLLLASGLRFLSFISISVDDLFGGLFTSSSFSLNKILTWLCKQHFIGNNRINKLSNLTLQHFALLLNDRALCDRKLFLDFLDLDL